MKTAYRILALWLLVFALFPVSAKKKKTGQLAEGTITAVENGDLMCYLTIKDTKGKLHTGVGADFEICSEAPKILNKRVKLSYKKASVNDCESAEPCGKSKTISLVHKVTPLKK